MDCKSTRLPYRQTGAFSSIALDYIDQASSLKQFFSHAPTIGGIQQAIAERRKFPTNRGLLVEQLEKQYEAVEAYAAVTANIRSLLNEHTFTVTTAHQNNIFTGPLYFIYKILHTVALSKRLKEAMPENNFVPVYYIGSEDADLEELNHIQLDGNKLVWDTHQTGAVGRMTVDAALIRLIDQMEGQLGVEPFGKEFTEMVRKHYRLKSTIQDATFSFVNELLGEYGVVVLLPDNAGLKRQMIPIFRDDLLQQSASTVVQETASRLQEAGYKTQAHPREINLFYLEGDSRQRIEKTGDQWQVLNRNEQFDEQQLMQMVEEHPERFSPNVILRGIYQETILPNIAFIGGGGELAYWLELRDLFTFYKVPYPVLVLRNSFLLIEQKWQEKIDRLGFDEADIFLSEQELVNKLVTRDSNHKLRLNGTLTAAEALYDSIKKQAAGIDATLEKHVEALKTRTVYRLQELEKKMLRAEKRKFTDQQRQIGVMKQKLFPGGLQERTENIGYFYARWGRDIIRQLHDHSLGLEQEFVVLRER